MESDRGTKGEIPMLQDMEVGRLENEFHNIAAGAEDVILCF